MPDTIVRHTECRRSICPVSRAGWRLPARLGAVLCAAALVVSTARTAGSHTPGGTRLVVSVSGFENDDGTAGVALWNGPDGFPEDVSHAIATAWVKIDHNAATTAFDDVQPGTYAVTVFHDENDNRTFDKRWFGLPTEAWGVSNNVRPHLRAPRFDEAAFHVAGAEQTIAIHVE